MVMLLSTRQVIESGITVFKLKNTYSILLWPNRRSFEQICSGNESDTNVFLGKFFLCVRLIVYIF